MWIETTRSYRTENRLNSKPGIHMARGTRDDFNQSDRQALTNREIMPHTIRGTTIVLETISTYVIGCYVDMKRQGTYDDGYRYTA